MTETELIFTEALGCKIDKLYLDRDRILTLRESRFISSALKRRALGEPIQYILGKTEFMGLEFKLNKHVLIPRPETEILVETVLRYAKKSFLKDKDILELGTGSGCIAISVAKSLLEHRVAATDISLEALRLAALNAKLNGVGKRVSFILSNLFSSLFFFKKQYSLCVSNPPYIPTDEIDKLQPELKYEPRIALDGGRDGLKFYRRIINEPKDYLQKGGILILEIGYNKSEELKKIFSLSKRFEIVEIIKDYNSIDRVVVAKRS
ncbi:MAG: peptide chain release factor N(5)-glutamine methyltransferase [Candidatus Omnitrophota bacterium]